MKFGTIGAGTVALAFARQALAAGHEVVLSSRREALASKAAELGHGASAAMVEAAAASTMSYSPFPGRMSRTRYGAYQNGTGEYSSTQQIRSSSTAPNWCWPTWAVRGRAKW